MGGALLAVGLFGAVLAYAVVQANAPARAQQRSGGGGGEGGAPADMPQRIERFFASNPSPEQIEALAAELERAGLAATAQQLRAIAAQRRASASSSSTSASSSTPRASSSSASTAAETLEQELGRMGMTREALDRQLATLGAEEDDVAELRRQGYPRIADYVETRVREGRAREAAASRESAPPRASSSSSSSTREEPRASTRESAPRSGSSTSSSTRAEGPPPAMPPPPIERPVEGRPVEGGEGAPSTLEEELSRAEREHPGSRAQYDRAMREASAADLRTIARPVRTRGYPLIADSLERRATELDHAAHREREAGSSSEPREERPRREAGGGSRETAGPRESSSTSSTTTTTRTAGVDLRQARRLAPRVAEDVRSRRYNYSRDRVREFQRAAGLTADGEYGGATRGALIYFGVQDAPSALFRPTATVRYTPPDGATETASSSTSDGRTALA